MQSIKITNAMVELLKKKKINDKILLLVTDDGGGKYSLQGGACSIGSKFSIVVVDQMDDGYQVKVENNADLNLYTSEYDLHFLNKGLTMDFKNYLISLKDDTGMLDGAVLIANGQEILDAFEQGTIASGESCYTRRGMHFKLGENVTGH